MNWTGGSFARHSRNNGNAALIRRQKQHFAKARTKIQNGSRPSLSSLKLSFAHHRSNRDPFGAHADSSWNRQMSASRYNNRRPGEVASEVGRARWPGPETITPTQKESVDHRAPLPVREIEHQQEAEHANPVFQVKAETVKILDGLYDEASPQPSGVRSTSDQCRLVHGGTLEEQKARLLSKDDWVGTNITGPLKIKYPAVTDRSNIGKRRKLEVGYVPQYAGPVRRIHGSARLGHSVAYGLPGDREARHFEEPVIRIGRRTVDARVRQSDLRHEDADEQPVRSNRLRSLLSESTIPTMVEAEPQESISSRRQMNLGLHDTAEGACSSNHAQDVVPSSIIPATIEREPERLGAQPSLYRNGGTLPIIDRYNQNVTPSHDAERKARDRIGKGQITLSRSRQALSEIGLNKTRTDRLSRPVSTLSIRPSRADDYNGVAPATAEYKQSYPRDTSMQSTSEAHPSGDFYRQESSNSDPPTPIGTEILFTPGLPQGVFRLSPSPPPGPAGRVIKDSVRRSPKVSRSTVASVGTEPEPSSISSVRDELIWKDWVSAEPSGQGLEELAPVRSSGETWEELVSANSSQVPSSVPGRIEEQNSKSLSGQRRGSSTQDNTRRDKESFQSDMTASIGHQSDSNSVLTRPYIGTRSMSPDDLSRDQNRISLDKQEVSREETSIYLKQKTRNAGEESWMEFVFSDGVGNEYEER